MIVEEGRQSCAISIAANLHRVQLGSNPILMDNMVYDFPRKVKDQSGRTGLENHGRNEEKCMNIPITFSQKSKILIEILLANKKKINFNINFIVEGGTFLNILT